MSLAPSESDPHLSWGALGAPSALGGGRLDHPAQASRMTDPSSGTGGKGAFWEFPEPWVGGSGVQRQLGLRGQGQARACPGLGLESETTVNKAVAQSRPG